MAKRSAPSRDPETTDRVVLLAGKEAFLREEHTRTLREALEAEHGAVDVFRYDGQSAQVAEVMDEARSFGLMAAHKVIVIDSADQFVKDDHRPLVERYCDAPSDSATIILRADKWYKGKLDAKIQAAGVIVKCDEPSASFAVTWIGSRCKKVHNLKIDRDAAEQLVDRLGTSLGRLDGEISKLALLAKADGTIHTRHVEAIVGRSREEEVWAIQRPVVSGDVDHALAQLRATLDNAPKAASIPVSWALMDLARKLHALAATIESGGSVQQAAKTHRLWGPSGDAMTRLAGNIPPAHTRRMLDLAIDADLRLKTGVGDHTRVLERTTVALTATIRRAMHRAPRSGR